MANKGHLARLKQGVEAWNQWREAANPDIQADLHGADLCEADLAKLVIITFTPVGNEAGSPEAWGRSRTATM
jgi:hypothetical protein